METTELAVLGEALAVRRALLAGIQYGPRPSSSGRRNVNGSVATAGSGCTAMTATRRIAGGRSAASRCVANSLGELVGSRADRRRGPSGTGRRPRCLAARRRLPLRPERRKRVVELGGRSTAPTARRPNGRGGGTCDETTSNLADPLDGRRGEVANLVVAAHQHLEQHARSVRRGEQTAGLEHRSERQRAGDEGLLVRHRRSATGSGPAMLRAC